MKVILHKSVFGACSLAAMLSAPIAHAESLKLVCNGIGLEGGVSPLAMMMLDQPNVSGVLIRIEESTVTVSGNLELRGSYQLNKESSDEATFAFFSQELAAGGILNRYSGEIEMAICEDLENCDEPEFHFKGTCSKQERKF